MEPPNTEAEVEIRGPGRPHLFEDGGQRVGPLLISTKHHKAISRLSLTLGKSFNAVMRRAIALGLRRMVWDAKYSGTRGGPGKRHALAEELQFEVRQHLEAYRKNLLGVVRAAVVDAMAYDGEDGYDLDSLSGADGAIGVVFDHVEADWLQTLVEGGYPL